MRVKSLIVGITGASGVIYGVRMLEKLKELGIETHLVVTKAGARVIALETDSSIEDVRVLATWYHEVTDLMAPLTSGSFPVDGMAIAPCSVKTLAGIACGYTDNLLLRAADVTLKEKRPLILLIRETPLNPIHLRNMLRLAEIGVGILPASPAFYYGPQNIEDLVDYVVGKAFDLLGIIHNLYRRWGGEATSVP